MLALGQLEYLSRRYFAVGWGTVSREVALAQMTSSWCHLLTEWLGRPFATWHPSGRVGPRTGGAQWREDGRGTDVVPCGDREPKHREAHQMSNFNESGELRQVEQDHIGRPAERAEQLRQRRDEVVDGAVVHDAGNTGWNHAAIDDHLTVAELEERIREAQHQAQLKAQRTAHGDSSDPTS